MLTGAELLAKVKELGDDSITSNASLDLVLTMQPHVAQAVERALRNSTDTVVIETHQELSRLMHFRGLPTLPV